MQRVACGLQDALMTLFARSQHLVFDVALRIVRDPGEAEEVVQTVFLDIYRAVANFDSRKGILKVWILQYAYHRALHRKRHLASNHFYRWEELEAPIGPDIKHLHSFFLLLVTYLSPLPTLPPA